MDADHLFDPLADSHSCLGGFVKLPKALGGDLTVQIQPVGAGHFVSDFLDFALVCRKQRLLFHRHVRRADDDDNRIAPAGIDLHLNGEGFNAIDSGG
jgi:hypothetical protein